MTVAVIPEVVVPGRRLGRHVNHDPRSLRYRLRARAAGELKSVQHPPSIACLDQGAVGSCVGNTGTELLATDAFREIRPVTLDETYAQSLYSDCTQADAYPGTWRPDDTGTDAVALGKVLVARGLASGYQHLMDMASFLATLQLHAIPIGIAWRSSCDQPSSTGLIRYTGAVRGGHELLAWAYDADRQWVGLQNHWTASWGVDGRCWISVADLAAALDDQGDATVIVPATKPAPAPAPSPDDLDAILWSELSTWAATRHLGANAAAAKSVSAWARLKKYT